MAIPTWEWSPVCGLLCPHLPITVQAFTHRKPVMHRTFFSLVALIERSLRLLGLDVYTLPDDSGRGFLEFDCTAPHPYGREYWGLGLHITVSPLRVHPHA
jgi:hypothetical protein